MIREPTALFHPVFPPSLPVAYLSYHSITDRMRFSLSLSIHIKRETPLLKSP